MKIILYVMDSLRADHLSCYGYPKNTSPNLDALASEGVLFENAFSASTWTRPSASSLLTGLYPLKHGTETFYSILSEKLPRISTILQSKGVTCAAFSTIVQVSKNFGFDSGFDEFHELFRGDNQAKNGRADDEIDGILPSSEDLNAVLFPWLEQNAEKDFFALAWSIDTHVPYTVPRESAKFLDEKVKTAELKINFKANEHTPEELGWIKQLYESSLFYNDQQFGKLCRFLKDLRIYDDCLIIVMGDHGEVFNEHLDPKSDFGKKVDRMRNIFSSGRNGSSAYYGRRGHIIVPPYEEDIHVPLIFKFPGNKFSGKRVPHLASLVDVTPTILSVVDPKRDLAPFRFDGRNLMPELDVNSNEAMDNVIYCSGKSYPFCPAYYCIRSENWKYILTEPPKFSFKYLFTKKLNYLTGYLRNRFLLANEVLYHLPKTGENKDVLKDNPEVGDSFKTKLTDWIKNCKESRKGLEQPSSYAVEVDEVNMKQLKALGYTN